MVDESPRREPEHDSDYDGAWKEALRDHLPEFIGKYFPAEYAVIDWSVSPEWFDKELSQVLGQSGRRNREVDVLVKVRLLTGCEQWILLHLEIQTSYEEDFASRIAKYNAGLHWVFQHRAMTLVVLADLRRGWRPDEDVFQVATFESRLKFPVCKLIENLDSEWQNETSLPVLLARAQVEALRTSGDAEGRYRAKWLLVRGLYGLGYNAQQVRETFRLIDWMMHLRVDLDERFRAELTAFEEQGKMPYVTSIERLAEARGKAELILAILGEKCGSPPETAEDRVRRLNSEQLQRLGKDLLRFQSLADLESWLNVHASEDA
jgi:hypothetical protein